jgi:hypothetical protein
MIPLTPGTVAASSNIAATWAYEPTSVFILKLIGDVDRWIVAAIEVAAFARKLITRGGPLNLRWDGRRRDGLGTVDARRDQFSCLWIRT